MAALFYNTEAGEKTAALYMLLVIVLFSNGYFMLQLFLKIFDGLAKRVLK